MNRFTKGFLALAVGAVWAVAPCLVAAADIPLEDLDPVGLAWDQQAEQLFVADASEAVTVLDDGGDRVGEVKFSGKPESVQALALAAGVLYVADIGDADLAREFVTVFGVTAAAGQQPYKAWDFNYPDGPHDAKAFLVSGKGRFYFITDGEDAGIYRAELNPARDRVNKLTRAADAPKGVTDAVFLPDGASMALRTAEGVSILDAYTFQEKATTTYVGASADEALTAFTSGRMLVGARGVLRDEPLPEGRSTVTPSPVASPSAGQTGEPATGEQATSSRGGSRSGTLLALAGAAVVAVIAGAVVLLARD